MASELGYLILGDRVELINKNNNHEDRPAEVY
jgi:hypothetical protein